MWLQGKNKKGSDEELVRSYYLSGDKQLLGDLFERHVRTIYGVCLYYLKDRAAAQDATMQVFEKMITGLRATEVRNFKGWLSFVVRNHCLNTLKQSSAHRPVPESYLDFEYRQPDLEEEERIAAVSEERMLEHLQASLPLLRDQQRTCIQLFYLQGRSYEDISVQTGYSIKEVKSYIQNGKRNLKIMIEEKNKKNEAA